MSGDANDAAALEQMIGRYNDAWNAHDVDAILALHAPGMVFENHTAGELAEGDAVGPHIAAIFEGWPDLRFDTRRLYVRDGLVVQEWTAHATHTRRLSRGDLVAEPSGKRAELGRHGRHPVRGRAREAQGRLLGLRRDPAAGGAVLGRGRVAPRGRLAAIQPVPPNTIRTVRHRISRSSAQRPVLDVPEVELDALVPRQRGAAVDLRPAGDPGLDREAAALARRVLLDLHRHRRPRADDRHLAAQHVDEVRQLVERGAAQQAPDARDARVALV